MAQAILQDRRAIRAEGIVARQECELQDNGAWRVRDTGTGSGRWHQVFQGHCSCMDYLSRGSNCKHLRAVEAEERSLAQYCADWNTLSDEARAAGVDLDEQPGSFLDGPFDAFDDMSLTLDVPAGPRCPQCGAQLQCRQYYVGGRGYQFVKVCTRDASHRALQA